MSGRLPSASAALLVLAAAATAGCRRDETPRRVPDDGAPCSVTMPGAPDPVEETIRLDALTVTERAWVLRPPAGSGDPPTDVTTYVVRRGAVPAGAALRDAALLDAAAARVARGIALQEGTKRDVAKVSTDAGEAAEVRWTSGRLHNATRVLLVPGGYCEVTILGAPSEAEVTSFLGSVRVRPGATP